jgi:hypothetical protein
MTFISAWFLLELPVASLLLPVMGRKVHGHIVGVFQPQGGTPQAIAAGTFLLGFDEPLAVLGLLDLHFEVAQLVV